MKDRHTPLQPTKSYFPFPISIVRNFEEKITLAKAGNGRAIKINIQGRGCGLDTCSSGQTPAAGSCESGSGYIKGRGFLDRKATVNFSERSPIHAVTYNSTAKGNA